MDIANTRRGGGQAAERALAEPVERKTAGAQTLRRGLQILRLLAQHQEEGMALADLVEGTGLERPTAYRLLCSLEEERFVERNPDSKRYRLGIDAMQLGAAAAEKAPIVDLVLPVMKKLARLSGDTVFLVVPQGDFTVCLHREEGSFPVRVFTTVPGQRRLLGIGAGGLALMAGMDDEAIRAVHRRRSSLYAQAQMPIARLMAAVHRARRKSYAEIVDTITEGVSGVGCAFALPYGASAALSFGAISSRMTASRRDELGAVMVSELAAMTARGALEG